MVQVSVVAGTYNRLPLLQEMVASARQSAKDLDLEIVLVDGGSTDGTQDWCKGQPDITLIEHGELLGAIQAYNDGCAAASGEYVVIGNDDITFDADTIHRAFWFMRSNPEIGQGAFGHRFQRRGEPNTPKVQGAFSYIYGQCCITPKWLGDWAGWWGDEGMRTYGGDTRLSLRIWELGWPVVQAPGCSVTDREHQDELREINSDSPWRQAKVDGKTHPDLEKFNRWWPVQRLPHRNDWIGTPARRVLRKAALGNLRTMRFKGMMRAQDKPRTALIDVFGELGPVQQVNQNAEQLAHRNTWQQRIVEIVNGFQPDLLILQAQRPGVQSITLETIQTLRQRMPYMLILNFDGDTHYPLEPWHAEIAQAVDLQLVVSPIVFPWYAARGIAVAYWPIGIEQEYLDQQRAAVVDGPDVLFTGALYGIGHFPEAEFRRDAVLALSKSGLRFDLFGYGWENVGLKAGQSVEEHAKNADMMARAKMTLSISQSKELWGYSSDRLYNITATGCPALVQRFAGMEQHGYVDGETCIVFHTIDEMVQKARYYLEHEAQREAIGAAGRVMTHNRHTWRHRVDSLFAILEGLP